MAIEVEVTGNGKYAGARSNIGDYTVSEDSTPVEASDTSGGTGQITFTAVDDPSRLGSVLLLNDTVKLTDGDRGDTEGRINQIRGNNGMLSVTADSRLGRLVVDKQADAVTTTFADAITYYLSLGGITTGIAIDSTLGPIPVVAPGWRGDLWTKVKELCVSVGAEISLVKGNVTLRPVRGRRALEINDTSLAWDVLNSDLAKQVEVYYYNSEYKSNSLVYPASGNPDDLRVYTIDANTSFTVNIPVNVTLTSIQQPAISATVAKNHSGSSVYAVSGRDGLLLTPSEWINSGGELYVAIGEDQRSIDLTIIGPNSTENSPYRIAVSEGPSDYYSSLRIVGDGLHFSQESIILPTGADEASTSRDIGATVDNVFIRTRAQAQELGMAVAGKWASAKRVINANKASINRPGETNPDYDYATFGEFNAYAATEGLTTLGNFNTEWSGQTFEQFNEYWYSLVSSDFDFQVFGNANGARLQWRRSMYRIRQASVSAGNVTYSAEADTTFGDFDSSAGENRVLWSQARVNQAHNPAPYDNGNLVEWQDRWAFVRTHVWDGSGPLGFPYFRWTSPSLQAIAGRGWDTYGNPDLGSPGVGGMWNLLSVINGQPITVHYFVRSSVATTWNPTFRIHNNAGSWLTSAFASGGDVTIPANTWTHVSKVVTPTATGYMVFSNRAVGAQNIPLGGTIDGSRMMIEAGNPGDNHYFDGYSGFSENASYTWFGDPGWGPSIMWTPTTQATTTPMTFMGFNALYAGLTFADFSLVPLPNVLPEYDR